MSDLIGKEFPLGGMKGINWYVGEDLNVYIVWEGDLEGEFFVLLPSDLQLIAASLAQHKKDEEGWY